MKIFSSKSGCCFLDLLEKLQIRVCRIDILTLAASLELLDHHGNVGGLIFFYKHYFGRYSSELVELVPLLFSRGWSTCYSNRLYGFPVSFPRCYEDVSVNSFFPLATTTLWNSLPAEY